MGQSQRKINSLNKDQQKQLLSKLGINPYDFNHKDMEPLKLPLKVKEVGVVKSSAWYANDDDGEFSYINLSDSWSGEKALFLFQEAFESIESLGQKCLVEYLETKSDEVDEVSIEFLMEKYLESAYLKTKFDELENERIKFLIDKYFAVLGETELGEAEFSKEDLRKIKNPPQPPTADLRTWDLNNFIIRVGFDYSAEIRSNYVVVIEKMFTVNKRMTGPKIFEC